jgi:hypothetical protein
MVCHDHKDIGGQLAAYVGLQGDVVELTSKTTNLMVCQYIFEAI